MALPRRLPVPRPGTLPSPRPPLRKLAQKPSTSPQPPSPQFSASQIKSVHLLRALLREASYLPDTAARTYFRRYIVNRFRAYQPARNASKAPDAHAIEKHIQKGPKRRSQSIIDSRMRPMQRKAQKGLNYLRRANLGEHPCLQNILYLTYGRMGKRRYTLLQQLLIPDEAPSTTEEPAPLQKMYYSNTPHLSLFAAPHPKTAENVDYIINISDRYSKLRTALRAQASNGVTLKRKIRRASIITPVKNVWQRSMPIKRARGNVRRWYAETMENVLPPLPNDEWDAIQAMAQGTRDISLVKRRSPAIELHPSPVDEMEQFTAMVQDALTLNKPSRADKMAGANRPHTLTPTYMRRLYAKILVYCSKLEWNDEHDRWESVWGSTLQGVNPRLYSEPVSQELFDGIQANGRLKQEKTSEPTSDSDAPNGKGSKKSKYMAIPFYVDYLPPDHPVRKEVDAFRNAHPVQSV